MKFYSEVGGLFDEDEDGDWVKRDEAERAAKDAVEMAKLVQDEILKCLHIVNPSAKESMLINRAERNHRFLDAQSIIERYEGGKG